MEFIEIIKAIILGIIEGITEWLPVSSTGHMILVDEFLQLNMSPEREVPGKTAAITWNNPIIIAILKVN